MNHVKNNIPPFAIAIFVFMFFLIGNTMRDDPHTFSAFPDAVTVLSISLILIFFIWHKHKDYGSATFRNLLGYGEKISRKSALIYGVLCTIYAVYFFGYFSKLVALIFISTLFIFYIIGLITSLVTSSVLKTRKPAID